MMSRALGLAQPIKVAPTRAASDWRTEITHRGRYWQYRRGSGKNREYLPGGKAEKLPKERLNAYYQKKNSTRSAVA